MAVLVATAVAIPFAGFLILALGRRLRHEAVAAIGVGSIGASMVLVIIAAVEFAVRPPAGHAAAITVWRWFVLPDLAPGMTLYVDALSIVMALVVTIVSFLIHAYSARFMRDEEGYGRFFAYMNLFVGSMLVLVLSGNFLLLYLGWEGVGLCSYLLIGFWYKSAANGRAAMKAFIVTRVGDAALLVGLFVIYFGAGTLNIDEAMGRAAIAWPAGSVLATAAAALILGGAVGKSAQLPLQVWLPDAMAGPTPVSALIHAATMVTAGVYLIARTHVLFVLAPTVQLIVAIIGAATLVLAGFSAATQSDFKRSLAYSTISQIGYMFLALGAGAWSAAIFHFVTHAFFKSLLFLCAGAVIMSLGEEHDMFRMGGLRRRMPVVFWTFLVGCVSMAAIPPGVSGFFSKDWILSQTWLSGSGGPLLWAAGLLGVFLTATYTFRMLFLVFFGEAKTQPTVSPGPVMLVPLVILAVPAALVGWLNTPAGFGRIGVFSSFISTSMPPGPGEAGQAWLQTLILVASQAASLAGLCMAYLLVLARPSYSGDPANTPIGRILHRFLYAGWGFDWLYDRAIVRPFLWVARVNRGDVVDLAYRGIAAVTVVFHWLVSRTQTGQVRWYAAAVAIGAIVILAFVVLQ